MVSVTVGVPQHKGERSKLVARRSEPWSKLGPKAGRSPAHVPGRRIPGEAARCVLKLCQNADLTIPALFAVGGLGIETGAFWFGPMTTGACAPH